MLGSVLLLGCVGLLGSGSLLGCSSKADEKACTAPTSMKVGSGSSASCGCDLNGVFAMRVERHVVWAGIAGVEDGSDTVYSWTLRRHTYRTDGTLSVESIPCGETAPELCGAVASPIPAAAYAEFIPPAVFGSAGMPTDCNAGACPSFNVPAALPGKPFKTPETAALLGITLTNPLDPTGWPSSRQAVAGGTLPQTNGAAWADHDGDGQTGITVYAVPPGGSGSLAVQPMVPYDAPSTVCPRVKVDGGPTALDYAWWPALDGLSVRRIKRFHGGYRVIQALDGTIQDCDTISGAVTGPDDGQLLSDTRFGGCVRCDAGEGADCVDAPCEPGPIDFLDGQDQTKQHVESASFVMQRVKQDATCADVRAMSFP